MYIWECAVKQLAAWGGTERENLTLSVNLSAKDFFNVDVYQVLSDLVDRYGVDPGKLRLEITETALLEEPESSNEMVRRLRERGFVVEIDDFGKGYSSLGMLKDIQADVLKVSHHGSNTATTAEFLKAVSPAYAVVSVGAGNDYSHPHASVLRRLEDSGCSVFRTDLNGTVVFRSNGAELTVESGG